jgi:hypothetical protein
MWGITPLGIARARLNKLRPDGAEEWKGILRTGIGPKTKVWPPDQAVRLRFDNGQNSNGNSCTASRLPPYRGRHRRLLDYLVNVSTAQAPFLVSAVLTGLAAVFGILVGRGGKPYRKVTLLIHLFFYIWLTIGFGFVVYGVSIASATKTIWIAVTVMGVTIVIQLVTAVLMLNAERVGKVLPLVHIVSAVLLGLSEIGAFIATGLRL